MDFTVLQRAYDQNPLGFLVIKPIVENGAPVDIQVSYINPAAAKILGAPAKALLEKRLFRMFDGLLPTTWLSVCYETASGLMPQGVYDFSPKPDQCLQIDCFQYAAGYCGCILQDIADDTPALLRPESKPIHLAYQYMTPEEEAFSAILEQWSIPFSERSSLRAEYDFLYIADPETRELLYIEGLLGKESVFLGRKCYEALQGYADPCPFCNNQTLRYDQYHIWQHYSDALQREYLLRDKLVKWNGRPARMEVALDITSGERKAQLLSEALASRNLYMNCSNMLAEDAASFSSRTAAIESLRRVIALVCDYFQADSGFILFYGPPKLEAHWSKIDDSPTGLTLANAPPRSGFGTLERPFEGEIPTAHRGYKGSRPAEHIPQNLAERRGAFPLLRSFIPGRTALRILYPEQYWSQHGANLHFEHAGHHPRPHHAEHCAAQ